MWKKTKVKMDLSGVYKVNLKKDDILCRAGEDNNNLYKLQSGCLLVFVLDGSKVTPLGKINPGEYVGELSFFDKSNRSAYVVATQESELIEINDENMNKQFPKWMLSLAKYMTKQIRDIDETIRTEGIKRKKVESIRPLSIEEQTYYFQLVKNS